MWVIVAELHDLNYGFVCPRDVVNVDVNLISLGIKRTVSIDIKRKMDLTSAALLRKCYDDGSIKADEDYIVVPFDEEDPPKKLRKAVRLLDLEKDQFLNFMSDHWEEKRYGSIL